MKIAKAEYIYLQGSFVEGYGFVFDQKIIDVAPFETLVKNYPNCEILDFKDQIIMPGLVNVHQHLEFSANKTTLSYGAFMPWLDSVIQNREMLAEQCSDELIQQQLRNQLRCGTTTIGEISSSGADLNACAGAKQRVVFFNELIGSNPAAVDALYADFNARLYASKRYASDKFYPALAIHSPYSVHPVLLKKALLQAKEERLKVSAHFLESQDEYDWLKNSNGGFLSFFEKFFGLSKALNSADEFLNAFDAPTIFTHCNYANDAQKALLQKHFVAHCPVSNRLLGSKKLDIKAFDNLCLATDGLSSNISLSLFDEMRAALFVHEEYDLEPLCNKLLQAVTTNAAQALNLPVGAIEKERFADFIVLSNAAKNKAPLASQLILHTKKANEVYVSGKKEI
jgi:cytosine/adenosine deaminase-related metal-dependent hydrolase